MATECCTTCRVKRQHSTERVTNGGEVLGSRQEIAGAGKWMWGGRRGRKTREVSLCQAGEEAA